MPAPETDRHVATPASPRTKGSLSPLRVGSQGLLRMSLPLMHAKAHALAPDAAFAADCRASPVKANVISRRHERCVDVGSIPDDYYTQLLSWSPAGQIAIAVDAALELRRERDLAVVRRMRIPRMRPSSIAFSPRGDTLAVGTFEGELCIIDVEAGKAVVALKPHTGRVGALSWRPDGTLCTGSRDKSIALVDPRAPQSACARAINAHDHEVCGVSAEPTGACIASGGNDNVLAVWDARRLADGPLHEMDAHTAAVKAIAWSPATRGLLASGGGTADRTLRLWDVHGPTPTTCVRSADTGSQVCGVHWCSSAAVVTTHGFSANEAAQYDAGTLARVCVFTGHTARVLYSAMSPDRRSIATAAPDGTLRRWALHCEAPARRRLTFEL